MLKNQMIKRSLVAVALSVSTLSSGRAQALDETWTVNIAGQTVPVAPDGLVTIPNILAPDIFGAGGPGTGPDFISDDYVRFIASRVSDSGESEWAFSAPFLFSQGEVVNVEIGNLTFTDQAPPFPAELFVGVLGGDQVLTALEQSRPLTTFAITGDFSLFDVTEHVAWTSYRTSNPAIVTVSEDGLMTAKGAGNAFITASNTGATSVTLVQVVLGGEFGEVEGICRVGGVPEANVDVSILGLALSTQTDAQGQFSFSGVPVDGTLPLRVRAEKSIGGNLLAGVSDVVYPESGLITDTGILDLTDQTGLLNPGLETGNFTGFSVGGVASVVMEEGFIVPPEGVQMARITTQGAPGSSLTLNLSTVPMGAEKISWDMSFLTDELDNTALFNDTVIVTAVPPSGPPFEVFRLSVEDMRSGTLPNVAAPVGYDGMTGFLPYSVDLEAFAMPGEQLQVSIAVLDVGDSFGDSTLLIDNWRWE